MRIPFLCLLGLLALPALAVDQLTAGIEFPVTSSAGAQPWVYTTATSHDGQDAIRSGEIGVNQSTSVRIQVTGPGRLSFWWKVSSNPDEYFLTAYLDGVVQAKISGEVDWQQRYVRIPAGVHAMEWIYAKGN